MLSTGRPSVPGTPPPSAGRTADLGKEHSELRLERDALKRELAALRNATVKEAPLKSPGPPPSAAAPALASAAPAEPPNLRAAASALSKPWVEDAVQIRDAARREAALAAIREALGSGDPVRVLAGLFAVGGISQVAYDREAMHSLVLPCLRSEEAVIRRLALGALLSTGAGPADVDRLLAMEDDPSPEVRSYLPTALSSAARGNLTGGVARVLLKALDGASPRDLRNVLPQYWTDLAPELEAKFLELARRPETRADTIYYCLRGATAKTPQMVEVLIEALDDPTGETSLWALWGLARGIPESLVPRVAATLVQALEARSDTGGTEYAFFGLRTFGTAEEIPPLERIAGNPLGSERMRRSALETVEAIRRRLGR